MTLESLAVCFVLCQSPAAREVFRLVLVSGSFRIMQIILILIIFIPEHSCFFLTQVCYQPNKNKMTTYQNKGSHAPPTQYTVQ